MNQPDLGKKIAELRKAKGFTQEELVEKCNLNVRTLQRIESGEVTPRSYTVKIIFSALDYPVDDSSETGKTGSNPSKWLEQLVIYVFDLFNLKTNKMKKISILSVILIVLLFGLFIISTEGKAQKTKNAIIAIENSQKNINTWLNKGQVDSVLTLFREDACMMPSWCGKIEIRENIQNAIDGKYKLIEFQNISISVADSIAVQKYYDVFEYLGNTYRQKGITEWRLTNGKWLIVNDAGCNY
jgi:transcriptional regulator with XRE-family HTH domain